MTLEQMQAMPSEEFVDRMVSAMIDAIFAGECPQKTILMSQSLYDKLWHVGLVMTISRAGSNGAQYTTILPEPRLISFDTQLIEDMFKIKIDNSMPPTSICLE